MDLEKADFINNWESWKGSLSRAVNLGQAVGMSQETIERIASKVGSFLSAAVDPENREQRLLQELWRVGDDSDRETLARLIVKMVQTDKH